MLNFIVFGIETRLVELSVFFFFGFSRSAYREVDLKVEEKEKKCFYFLEGKNAIIAGRVMVNSG